MEEKRTRNNVEAEMLHCIVEAMLDAEIQLHEANVDQWQRILVDSCRRRKSRSEGAPLFAATRC